jgi:hypothetical protein
MPEPTALLGRLAEEFTARVCAGPSVEEYAARQLGSDKFTEWEAAGEALVQIGERALSAWRRPSRMAIRDAGNPALRLAQHEVQDPAAANVRAW